MCALYLSTQHRCSTLQLTCTVQPGGVSMGLPGNIAYKDNVDLIGMVAIQERLVLYICGLACSTYRVIKYIM